MAYPYNAAGYSQAGYPQNYNQVDNKGNGPSVFGTAALGLVGGSAVGAYKFRYPVKDGVVSDSFAKNALDKLIDKGYALEDKTFFKQMRNVMKKVDKITKPEKFKKLLNKNPEVCQRVYNTISTETVCDTLTKENLAGKKKALKQALEAQKNNSLTSMKDAIKACWNEEEKRFIQPDNFKDSKVFKVIKGTKSRVQFKKALKYGAITAGILGALTLVYKIFTSRYANRMQVVNNEQAYIQPAEMNYDNQIPPYQA